MPFANERDIYGNSVYSQDEYDELADEAYANATEVAHVAHPPLSVGLKMPESVASVEFPTTQACTALTPALTEFQRANSHRRMENRSNPN